jgi:hypothetical protein
MIVKVTGNVNGIYKEKTYDAVEEYTFTNRCDELGDTVFSGSEDVPYSLLELVFAKKDPEFISFNTRAYIMTGDLGKTVDVLHYDSRKEGY